MNAPYYADESVTLHHGDCLEVLRSLSDSSIDSVITDPPYGLSNTDPAHVVEALTRWANGDREFVPAGKGFMGKSWDAFVSPPAVWDECMRVLKPGGHLLAFAGSRTFDLMTLSIRFAGFDIRDGIAWLYGSGFPKSLDVSKAIDKAAPRAGLFDSFAAHYSERRKALGLTHSAICAAVGAHGEHNHGGASVNWERGHGIPTREQWRTLAEILQMPREIWEPLIERAEAEREIIAKRQVADRRGDGTVVGLGHAGNADITTPATPAAQQWNGWGSAMKPAFEPIVVARKPFTGTLAANVLTHGTGALNVDATRVGGASGRWPANVVMDGDTADALDAETGTLRSGSRAPGTYRGLGYMGSEATDYPAVEGDSGGASRFFPTFRYQAKAPTRERVKVGDVAHPTVKPLELMRWLVRLVTPPSGTVLEPFAGSGTTVEAATLEGFRCIAVEREADYLPLILARIERCKPTLTDPDDQLDLFGGAA